MALTSSSFLKLSTRIQPIATYLAHYMRCLKYQGYPITSDNIRNDSQSDLKHERTYGINTIGYQKGSNAAAHSVDSEFFYAVIYLPARSKTYINLYFLR